jgi:hypothetical protein
MMNDRLSAFLVAVFFIAGWVAPLGFILWGLLSGDTEAVLLGSLQIGLCAVCTFFFLVSISGGEQ